MNISSKSTRNVYFSIIVAILSILIYITGTAVLKNEKSEQKTSRGQAISVDCLNSRAKDLEEVRMERVVDGDTIEVERGCGFDRVRLIGVNTPETVDPRRPVQCFGKEASEYAKTLLDGKNVYLQTDKTQSERDKYQRLLAYVYLDPNMTGAESSVNGVLVKEGYGYEYTYGNPYKFQKQFKQYQKDAKEFSIGLWATSTCSGIK